MSSEPCKLAIRSSMTQRDLQGCLGSPCVDVLSGLAYVSPMDYRQRLVVDPEVRFGKPCVRGTRISVGDVLGFLASGMTAAEVVEEYPSLTIDDVLACLAYAADRESRTDTLPAA